MSSGSSPLGCTRGCRDLEKPAIGVLLGKSIIDCKWVDLLETSMKGTVEIVPARPPCLARHFFACSFLNLLNNGSVRIGDVLVKVESAMKDSHAN